ncbi:Golgi reassembly-stacking protein (GRASP) 55/56 family protein [Penicillium ucsense]|uniref:Golgi reassembly-stacking protein (GRASP) 55/56 family protein n=1 Tax=Penicillium ucsense TaxID=2839758 RepID=A0A8J8WGW4_9EURO|nr:Golgi reassembly-stacking protein (GRASP) 55/56 family protein [Penicillium ucsense]KAF7734469.1 Golgi reassembly-stacking protein (GRASP) 55/56 family protein [Penicillium ucsense]
MFGALNRFIGRLDGEPVPQPRTGPSDNAYGFQVLRNKDTELPLEPWFDFIIGINGHPIEDPDPNLFATEVRNCAGSSLTLELWSAKGQRTHTVTVPVSATTPSLGLSLQLAPLSSTQHIWHILGVPSPLSPAYRAGLLPHSDYIIGTPSGTLRGESALGELVEDHLDRTLVLWVYNSEFDVVREVELVPTRGWGGEGALGAELGHGALHRLPVGLGEEVEGPGEVVFETKDNVPSGPSYDYNNAPATYEPSGGNYLVPANLVSPPPLVPQGRVTSPQTGVSPASRRNGKARHGVSPNRAFDDYFAEGEQKSRAQDFTPSRKGTPLPPPPKFGAPPQASSSPAPTASEAMRNAESEGEPGPAQEE